MLHQLSKNVKPFTPTQSRPTGLISLRQLLSRHAVNISSRLDCGFRAADGLDNSFQIYIILIDTLKVQNATLMRSCFEPLHAMTQMKGDSETHPKLSPDDEFADYETWDKANLTGTADRNPDSALDGL